VSENVGKNRIVSHYVGFFRLRNCRGVGGGGRDKDCDQDYDHDQNESMQVVDFPHLRRFFCVWPGAGSKPVHECQGGRSLTRHFIFDIIRPTCLSRDPANMIEL
jgi:hypothetical protein